MKFLANENFPLKSILYLKRLGYDISSIGTDYQGIQDFQVMEIAISEERTILTFDRDYGELIFKHNHRPQKGVIYLRINDYTAEEPGMLVESLMKTEGFIPDHSLTVIDWSIIRQRKY
jgi:predicted nuclease of predicted toxin-antitoxin system